MFHAVTGSLRNMVYALKHGSWQRHFLCYLVSLMRKCVANISPLMVEHWMIFEFSRHPYQWQLLEDVVEERKIAGVEIRLNSIQYSCPMVAWLVKFEIQSLETQFKTKILLGLACTNVRLSCILIDKYWMMIECLPKPSQLLLPWVLEENMVNH